jgi:hypothetical protein
MHKKYLLFFIIVFFIVLHSAAQTVVITLPKNIKKADDLLKISFPSGQYQNKNYYMDMAIYVSSKLIFTGTSNIFAVVNNQPDDIFFTRFKAADSTYAASSNPARDLPDGVYRVQYKISSLTPKEIIVSQMETVQIGNYISAIKDNVNAGNTEQKKDSITIMSQEPSKGIKFSGYIDAYYGHYTDSTGINDFVKFASVSPRSDHFGLNTAILTAQYDDKKYRGIITLHFGDIAHAAWSTTFNSIMEAHAGILLHKNLWLDAGFFRTHFGTEGLLPKENFTSSVSVNTFYEPYFESGFRLNFTPNNKLAINLYVLNGYNIFEDNNHKKSLGTVITYALGDKGNIGFSNYTGDDTPLPADSISHLRMNNNIFFNYEIKKLKLQAGGNYCLQQNGDTLNKNSAYMLSGVLGLKYQLIKKFAVYTREEIFYDPQGFMSGVIIDVNGMKTGYRLWGETFGIEYKPADNCYVRLEERELITDKKELIFRWDGTLRNYRSEITLNMGVWF